MTPIDHPHGGGEGLESDRPPAELLNDRQEELAVHVVKAGAVHADPSQGRVGDLAGDAPVGLDLGEVPHPPEEAVGNAGGAAGAGAGARGGATGATPTDVAVASIVARILLPLSLLLIDANLL